MQVIEPAGIVATVICLLIMAAIFAMAFVFVFKLIRQTKPDKERTRKIIACIESENGKPIVKNPFKINGE